MDQHSAPIGLDGKSAMVTGGGQGIGRAVALALAAAGARVCVVGRRSRPVQAVARHVVDSGGQAIGLRADVRRRADVQRAFAEADVLFGPPEIIVAAAGTWDSVPVAKLTDKDMERMIATHVRGSLYCMQAGLDGMISRGGGRIILVSSAAATVGSRNRALHYAAAKGAVLGMTRAAAKELAVHRIVVNCVVPLAARRQEEPEHVAFDDIPLGRPTPEDIAGLFVFLASDAASHITGQVIQASGGAF